MFRFIFRHPIATFSAIALHLLIMIGFAYSSFMKPKVFKVSMDGDAHAPIQPQIETTEPMKTFAVDANVVQEQLALLKEAEEQKQLEQKRLAEKTLQEKQRLTEIKQKQLEEQRKTELAQKQAQEEKRKAEEAQKQAEIEARKAEESKRQAEIEKQKVEAQKQRTLAEQEKAEKAKQEALIAEKQRQEARLKIAEAEKARKLEEEKTKKLQDEIAQKEAEKQKLQQAALLAKLQKEQEEEEADLRRQLEAEEARKRAQLKAKEMKSLQETYITSIAAKVKDNWKTAAKVSDKAQCDLAIIQSEAGKIISVKVLNCNEDANKQFQNDAIKAVYRSEPLPAPPVKELFERHIQFNFKP